MAANEQRAGPAESGRPAIVLCQSVTGLAVVRALAKAGIDVHCFLFDAQAFTRYSRYGKKVPLYGKHRDEPFLLQFLIEYCRKLGSHPVVLPSSDRMALFLAKHADALREGCVISSTSYDDLASLVSKEGLYRCAAAAGVSVIPHIVTQDASAIAAWSLENPAPYLLKPFYASIGTERPFGKNVVLATREDLQGYVANHGTQSLVVQRMIEGGDGYVFDCYGYCDREGRVATMTSHRRLRQNPPNFGSTSYGEIPANFGTDAESRIFRNTGQLLEKVRYHGIFGIELLYERATGNFHVIDFNARPFLTIGHLYDCGVNLPAIAYRELTGEAPNSSDRRAVLRSKYWVDLSRDLVTLHDIEANSLIAIKVWLMTITRSRSFAYQDWRDPLPGIAELLAIARNAIFYLGKKLRGKSAASR